MSLCHIKSVVVLNKLQVMSQHTGADWLGSDLRGHKMGGNACEGKIKQGQPVKNKSMCFQFTKDISFCSCVCWSFVLLCLKSVSFIHLPVLVFEVGIFGFSVF